MQLSARVIVGCVCLFAAVTRPALGQLALSSTPESNGTEAASAASDPGRTAPSLSGPPPSWLAQHGIAFGLQYVAETFGWIRQPAPDRRQQYLGSFSPSVSLDLVKMHAGRGQIFVSAQTLRCQAPDAPTLQAVSNLEAPDFDTIGEVWYADSYLADHLAFKAGWQYADAEFGTMELAASFLNGSYGVNPTTPMPTYPDAALGVTLWVMASPSVSVGVGVFRGAAHDVSAEGAGARLAPFMILEARVEPFHEREPSHDTFRVGVWQQGPPPGERDDLVDGLAGYGFYATAEHRFWRESQDPERSDWGVFLQVGWAPASRADICRHLGGGASWRGPLPRRPGDEAGAGITSAARGDGVRETTLELFYRLRLAGRMFVQPDLQWIERPGGHSRGVAVGLRVSVEM